MLSVNYDLSPVISKLKYIFLIQIILQYFPHQCHHCLQTTITPEAAMIQLAA